MGKIMMNLSGLRKRNYLFMLAISFLSSVHLFGAVSVPFFTDLAKLGYAKMMLIESWFTISWFLLEIPTGVVAERLGRKASMSLGFLFTAIGAFTMGLFPSFSGLLIAHTILGLGGALVSGADISLFYESIEILDDEPRKRLMSNYSMAKRAGMIVGFLIGPYLASVNYPASLAWTFIGNGIIYLAVTALTLFLWETGKEFHESYLQTALKGIKEIIKNSPVDAIDYALVSPLLFMIYWLYQPVLLGKGLPLQYVGYVTIGMNLAALAVLKAINPKDKLLASTILSALLFSVLPFSGLSLAIATSIAIPAISSLREPLLKDEINRRIKERRAVANSSLSMLYNMSRAFIYPFAGFMMDKSFGLLMVALSIASTLMALALAVARKRRAEIY